MSRSAAFAIAEQGNLLTLSTRRERSAPESLTGDESAFVHRNILGESAIECYRL
jgi:hypothetical protein